MKEKIYENQYNAVVEQNKKLQQEINWLKNQMQKDNDYIIQLEKDNMIMEDEIEALKLKIKISEGN